MSYEEKLTGLQLEAVEEIARDNPDIFPASQRAVFIGQTCGYLVSTERVITVAGITRYMQHIVRGHDKCAERQRNLFGVD
jgi:hypothetical protein